MPEKINSKDMSARSERIVALFQAFKGKSFNQIPVPPFSKWLNGILIDAKRGDVEIEFEVRPEMANPTGLLHGGMQCGFMDDCIGVMCATLGYEGFLLSVDLHVDYLGKVKVGDHVRVRASLLREGRSIVHAQAEIKDLQGNLIATGNSNLLITTHIPDYAKLGDKLEQQFGRT